MKCFKKLFATLLMACMVMSLVACGNTGNSDSENNSSEVSTENNQNTNSETESTSEDEASKYTVKVVDADGNPLASVMVQICAESCMPGVTDANGVATFTVDTTLTYTAKIMTMPEGYDYSTDEHEFTYENGSTEVVITLKTAE